jgi:hypothetical protein
MTRKKLSLELDSLSIESFATTPAARDARGTVRGNDSEGEIDVPVPTPPVYGDACTCSPTDLCPTSAYYCATVRHTAISCKYTANLSCNA